MIIEEEISVKVGNELRQMRIKAGYKSYERFAYEHNISRIQYWKMENGNNFTLKSLVKVLNAHQISMKDFLNSDSFNAEKSEAAKRLSTIIEYSQHTKKEFSEKLGYKNTMIINHVLFNRNGIGETLAKKICESYSKLNKKWILTGKGKMLNN